MKNLVVQSVSWLTRVGKWLTIICAAILAIMMLINVVDIVGTKWFHWGIPGALDLSEEMMVVLTLLPIGYVLLERGHINISLVDERQSPSVRFIFMIIKCGIGLFVMAFVTWRTFVQFQYVLGAGLGKTGYGAIVIWPSNLIVVISFGFFTVVWLLMLIKTLVIGMETKKAVDSPL
jgi:TRAP-type C4-dicarboxylate transport system permease small subunit